jgi:hypothetical protein
MPITYAAASAILPAPSAGTFRADAALAASAASPSPSLSPVATQPGKTGLRPPFVQGGGVPAAVAAEVPSHGTGAPSPARLTGPKRTHEAMEPQEAEVEPQAAPDPEAPADFEGRAGPGGTAPHGAVALYLADAVGSRSTSASVHLLRPVLQTPTQHHRGTRVPALALHASMSSMELAALASPSSAGEPAAPGSPAPAATLATADETPAAAIGAGWQAVSRGTLVLPPSVPCPVTSPVRIAHAARGGFASPRSVASTATSATIAVAMASAEYVMAIARSGTPQAPGLRLGSGYTTPAAPSPLLGAGQPGSGRCEPSIMPAPPSPASTTATATTSTSWAGRAAGRNVTLDREMKRLGLTSPASLGSTLLPVMEAGRSNGASPGLHAQPHQLGIDAELNFGFHLAGPSPVDAAHARAAKRRATEALRPVPRTAAPPPHTVPVQGSPMLPPDAMAAAPRGGKGMTTRHGGSAAKGAAVDAGGKPQQRPSVKQEQRRRARDAAAFSAATGFTSRYVGVSWHKYSHCWMVQIRHGGERTCVGYFHDQEEAAHAYDAAVVELKGGTAPGECRWRCAG